MLGAIAPHRTTLNIHVPGLHAKPFTHSAMHTFGSVLWTEVVCVKLLRCTDLQLPECSIYWCVHSGKLSRLIEFNFCVFWIILCQHCDFLRQQRELLNFQWASVRKCKADFCFLFLCRFARSPVSVLLLALSLLLITRQHAHVLFCGTHPEKKTEQAQ